MKKNIFTLITVLIILNSACKKNVISETSSIQSSTLSEKPTKSYKENKEYLNERLAKTAAIITKLSRYKEFRTVVNEQVAKKFDGDYNVLLKDLIKAFAKTPTPQKLEIKTVSAIPTKINGRDPEEPIDPQQPISTILEELQEDLEIPFVVNGQTVYPQIYIPFSGSEALQTGDINPCDAPSYINYTYPVVVPFDGDENTGQIVFTGNSYDPFGQPITVQVSECFASQHTVWAVTINERTDGSDVTSETSTSSPLPGSSSTMNEEIYLPSMVIKLHKETWIKGASEIGMKYGFSWPNGINPTTNTYEFKKYWYWTTNPLYSQYDYEIGNLNLYKEENFLIDNFSRKHIKNDTSKPINFTYNFHLSKNSGNVIYLIIYEKDYLGSSIFNGSNKCPDIDGIDIPLYYVSNDPPYLTIALPIVEKNNPSPPSISTKYAYVNNSEITFISQYR